METVEVESNTHHEQSRQTPKLRRFDSLDIETSKVPGHHRHASQALGWGVVLQLAFQSIGVVYGDIGTSPLYVYGSTFPNGIRHPDDIVGVLSLIYYTFTLIPVVKYVFIVLCANDNGNGGTFALYSLLCRHVKIGLLPSTQYEDGQLLFDSNCSMLPTTNGQLGWTALNVKNALENSRFAKFTLLLVTILATSLVIGDGILTPSISVLSAVGGIRKATPAMTQDEVVWISVAILIFLFSLQRFGTDKVGYSFAPIICVWLTLNASIGLYNFISYDPAVIKALNPWHIVQYFIRNGKDAWISLGGVVLCITGTEALFADLAHFTVRSIQISMCSMVYPTMILAYSGLASYLRHHPENVNEAFFKAVPGPLYWPVFGVAVLAAIIASQAMISGTFSIIQQSLSLGCFPRVKVVHTSSKYKGQVYIPELNFFLMAACVCVTIAFKTTEKIGNAYGIAVVFAETITSSFMILVLILIWKKHVILVVTYGLVIMSVELTYLSSVLYKFTHGGYLPLAFATFLMTIMFVWNYVYRLKYYYEKDHKATPDHLNELATRSTLSRVPGIAIFYSDLVDGIPPIFEHYTTNIMAFNSVMVFVSFRSLPINKVPPEEWFVFRRVQPRELYMFRCIVRHGYTDTGDERLQEPFERLLIERLKGFIEEDSFMSMLGKNVTLGHVLGKNVTLGHVLENEEEVIVDSCGGREAVEEEVQRLDKARRAGVVHLVGESEVVAGKGSGFVKKIMIDYGYNFLKKNLRQGDQVLGISRKRLLKIGMIYEL